MILEGEGHDVVLADNGQMGLEQLRASTFDMVLTDLQMPELGGLDMCRIIRQEPDYATLPVIIMTTRNEMQDMRRGHEVGANMYITKPFEGVDLLRRLKKFLTPGGAATTAAETPAGMRMTPPQAQAALETLQSALQKIQSASEQAISRCMDIELTALLEDIRASATNAVEQCRTASAAVASVLAALAASATPALAAAGAPKPDASPPPAPPPAASPTTVVSSATKPAGPPEAPSEGSSPQVPAIGSDAQQGQTVLLIEPAESLRNTLKAGLLRFGVPVRAVGSEEAGRAACVTLGSLLGIVVVEATLCSPELVSEVHKVNPATKLLCLVGPLDEGKVPSDVSTLMRPFTIGALLTRLRELQGTS